MNQLRTALPFLVSFVLAGCAATMAPMKPGPVTIKQDLTVTLTEGWNQFVPGAQGALPGLPGAHEIWTVDGLTLDLLAFFVGIGDGEPLGKPPAESEGVVPRFRSAMSAHEIVELYEALVTQRGATFKLVSLGPASFGVGEGIRFEYVSHRRGDGLLMSGLGYATVVGGKLYLMTYVAPKSHFFARHRPAVEAVAASARINAKPREESVAARRSQGSGEASRLKQPGFIDRGREESRNFQFRSESAEPTPCTTSGTRPDAAGVCR